VYHNILVFVFILNVMPRMKLAGYFGPLSSPYAAKFILILNNRIVIVFWSFWYGQRLIQIITV